MAAFCSIAFLLSLLMPVAADAALDHDPTDTVALAGLQDQFEQIADRASRSVVAISVAASDIDTNDLTYADELNGQKVEAALDNGARIVGTGFVIDAEGYILTNEHVIGSALNVWVTTDDNRVYPAVVVGSDPRSDLAILKVPVTGLTPVEFGRGDAIRRGQWTIAVGNPYGLATRGNMSMSVGVVSAVGRSLPKLARKENRLYSNLIQTTAEINPGSSGGPLFDISGRVIGVNTAVILPRKTTNGISFAMPVDDLLLAKVQRLRNGQAVDYGYLGVRVVDPTPRHRLDAGLSLNIGATIEGMEPDSPAAGSSLKAGDIVTRLNGYTVTDSDDLVRLIGEAPVDRPVVLEIYRGKKTQTVRVQLEQRPASHFAVTSDTQRLRWRGLLLGPIPANSPLSGETGLVVVSIDNPTLAANVREGAILKSVGGQSVTSIIGLQEILSRTPVDDCTPEFYDLSPDATVATIQE